MTTKKGPQPGKPVRIGKLVAWTCTRCGTWWHGLTVNVCPRCQQSNLRVDLEDDGRPARGFYPNYDEGEGI